MPKNYKRLKIIYLLFKMGMSPKEIAEYMGCSVNWIYDNLRYIKRRNLKYTGFVSRRKAKGRKLTDIV